MPLVHGCGEEEVDMLLLENRIESFKNWPFREDCSCTPEAMAEAGFFFCGSDIEPDLAKCFVCLKELDGWDPDDLPRTEHEKHSPNCKYIKLGKKSSMLTLEEVLRLDLERKSNYMRRHYNKKKEEFTKACEQVRKQIVKKNVKVK